MVLLFALLLFMNCLTEYLLYKMMVTLNVLEEKNSVYYGVCSLLRIAWIFFGAWFAAPLSIFLIVLFILLFLNVIPYPNRKLLMNNFNMIIYLLYSSLLMTVIAIVGLLGYDVKILMNDATIRGIIMNATFLFFNVICLLLLYYHPESLWREDYDKSKVETYTLFLFICVIYHILDAVILSLPLSGRINYLLLASGDILILILMLNFLNYNYVFAKSAKIRKEYEDNQILIAQQYFEKESLRKLSELDSLTSTYNRREICSIMQEHIDKGHQLVCVFVDLDGLKQANDTYGHTFGDMMLKYFAKASSALLQENGYLARIGGDEFLLVFVDETSHEIQSRIEALQLELLMPENEKDRISFSYGISYDEKSVDSYIMTADQRMYANKNRKRRKNL